MLIATRRLNIPIQEMPIATIYLENNHSSHFRPFIDLVRIYRYLLLFAISGILSFLLDIAAFFLILNATDSLFIASYLARAISLFFNFSLNAHIVLKNRDKKLRTLCLFLGNCLLAITISHLFLRILSHNFEISNIFYGKILIEFSYFS